MPLTEEQLLNMSDEELAELDESNEDLQTPIKDEESDDVDEIDTPDDDETSTGDDESQDGDNGESEETDDEKTNDEDSDEGETAPTATEGSDSGGDGGTAGTESGDSDKESQRTEAEQGDTQTPEAKDAQTAEAQIAKLLSPFKANGRNIQVDSVDDAITLMRMGANYNKKMAALKPNLRVVKMLEQNEMSEDKLNFAIDLMKGDKAAIQKLLADNKIDPIDFDKDDKVDYTPTNHNTVTDAQVDLDQVLNDIRDSETYPKTIGVVSKEWDQKSRDIIAEDPNIIRVIDEHMQAGVYDKIADVMESEKALGRLTGTPDIVAYKQIGDRLHAAGVFGSKDSTDKGAAPSQETKTDPVKEEQRTQQRRAASTTRKTKPKASPTQDPDFNPLNMSDEEFEKLSLDSLYR